MSIFEQLQTAFTILTAWDTHESTLGEYGMRWRNGTCLPALLDGMDLDWEGDVDFGRKGTRIGDIPELLFIRIRLLDRILDS